MANACVIMAYNLLECVMQAHAHCSSLTDETLPTLVKLSTVEWESKASFHILPHYTKHNYLMGSDHNWDHADFKS